MAITIDFYNRELVKIVFTQVNDNLYLMEGGTYHRYGFDSEENRLEKKYSFVEPNGGPYISEGMTLGYINPKWIGKIVRYITPSDKNPKTYSIITYPERIVEAIVDNERQFKIYAESGNVAIATDNFNDAVRWIENKYEKDMQIMSAIKRDK